MGGEAVVRESAHTVAATADSILQSLKVRPSDPSILDEMHGLARVIADQTRVIVDLREGQRWPRQLMWAVIGAVIGAILAALVAELMK